MVLKSVASLVEVKLLMKCRLNIQKFIKKLWVIKQKYTKLSFCLMQILIPRKTHISWTEPRTMAKSLILCDPNSNSNPNPHSKLFLRFTNVQQTKKVHLQNLLVHSIQNRCPPLELISTQHTKRCPPLKVINGVHVFRDSFSDLYGITLLKS